MAEVALTYLRYCKLKKFEVKLLDSVKSCSMASLTRLTKKKGTKVICLKAVQYARQETVYEALSLWDCIKIGE